VNQQEERQDKPLSCPRGEDGCPIIEEIERLKTQVQNLSEEVRTDHLTGLYNVRHLGFSLEQEIERTRRSGVPTSLIMLDVDHFKSFNDTYGHTLGDKVLAHLANLIRSSLRKLDIPCRYGGEEFAIVLPSSPLMTGVQVAERLRECVAGSALSYDKKQLSITISLGVDAFYADSPDSIESFKHRVDQHLYAAKNAGRNCVKFKKRERIDSQVTADEKAALFDIDNNSDNKE